MVIQLCNRCYLAALYVVTCAECKQTEEARDIFRNNELLMRRIGQLDKVTKRRQGVEGVPGRKFRAEPGEVVGCAFPLDFRF